MHVGGAGSIEKRGPNTWRVRLALGKDPITGKYRQKSRTVHGTKADAVRARDEMRREIEGGLRVDAIHMTFGEFAREFVASRRVSGTIKEVTLVGDRMIIRRLLRYFGDMELREITVASIIRAQTEMLDDGYTQTMLHATMRKLSQMLKQAVRFDFLPTNPCDKIDIPPAGPRTMQALDAKGVRTLLAALTERERHVSEMGLGAGNELLERSRIMACRLAIATGMRRGEILGLPWKNVDLAAGTLRILQQYASDGVVRPPKTRSGIRAISLDEGIRDRLLEWRGWQKAALEHMGLTFSLETPVVTNTMGEFANPADFSAWWMAMREEAGFPDLRFHDLRHTQATLLIGHGVDIKTVQGRLGHSRAATTLDTYACALPENDRKAAELFRTLVNERDPQDS